MKPGLSKQRPFYVAKILLDNTDESHYLTIAQILGLLKTNYNIEAYRTTIQDDIELLITVGFDIRVERSSQNKYYLQRHEFEISEIKIIIDAIESAKFIPEAQSKQLANKITTVVSPFSSNILRRNIDVENRIKTDNDAIYKIIDVFNSAINNRRCVSFQYFTYNVKKEKKLRHQGIQYILSPYKLIWNGDFYYVNESLWPYIAEHHNSDRDLRKLKQIRCNGERFETIKEAYASPYGEGFLILFKAFIYFVLDEFYPDRKKAYDDLVTW